MDALADDVATLLTHFDNDVARVEELLAGILRRREHWLRYLGPRIDRAALEAALGDARRDAVDRAATVLAEAGLAPIGVGFAHALHTPYWALRSIAGLKRADGSRLVRAYHRFLIRAAVSPGIARLERLLNFCFPKSVILYAEKRGASATPAA